MALIPAQLPALKAYLDANLSALPDEEASVEMNKVATPDYYTWRSSVSRAEIYHNISPSGTTWDWSVYKNQNATEQNAWTQMFMGDAGPIGNLNFRQGILAIFSGAGGPTNQRNHCFASGKRKVTVGEKLYATAVVSPPANTGNDTGQPRGSLANPDNLGFEGQITQADVSKARLL